MNENGIARVVVDTAIQLHRDLGPGLLESVYETVMLHALNERGVSAERQVPIAFEYSGRRFEEGFRADLVVERKVILEIKSVEAVKSVHKKQLLTYLKLTGMQLGLLLNFGAALMKDGIVRIVNGLPSD